MVCYQKNWSVRGDAFQVLEAMDLQQIISRKLNPAGAERALAKCPEALPTSLIHAMSVAECEAFEAGKNLQLLRRGFEAF